MKDCLALKGKLLTKIANCTDLHGLHWYSDTLMTLTQFSHDKSLITNLDSLITCNWALWPPMQFQNASRSSTCFTSTSFLVMGGCALTIAASSPPPTCRPRGFTVRCSIPTLWPQPLLERCPWPRAQRFTDFTTKKERHTVSHSSKYLKL